MPGTTPTGTYTDPNFETQTGTEYKTNLDNAHRTGKRFTDAFAPHAATTPAMSVVIDAGFIFTTLTLIEQAQQTIASIPAPTTNPRIDRIVIDQITGVASRIAGTEGVSPSAPAITANKTPCARIALTVGQTTITNAAITDERVPLGVGRATTENIFAVSVNTGETTNSLSRVYVKINTDNQIVVRISVAGFTGGGGGKGGSPTSTTTVNTDYTINHNLGIIQQVTPSFDITSTGSANPLTGNLKVHYR